MREIEREQAYEKMSGSGPVQPSGEGWRGYQASQVEKASPQPTIPLSEAEDGVAVDRRQDGHPSARPRWEHASLRVDYFWPAGVKKCWPG